MAYKQEQITPYGKGGKQEQIRRMFDKIAPSYDRLNHALSLGIDRRWRRTAIDALGKHFPPEGGQGLLLDIATGTGDFAMLLAERIKPQHIIGADISEGIRPSGHHLVPMGGLHEALFSRRDLRCCDVGLWRAQFPRPRCRASRDATSASPGRSSAHRGTHSPTPLPHEAVVLGLCPCRDAPARSPHQSRRQRLHLSASLDGSFPTARTDGKHPPPCRLQRSHMAPLHLRHQHNVLSK